MADVQLPVLEICDLSLGFRQDAGLATAVDGVSLKLFAGQTLGLVGESGSGKSVTAAAVLGLLPMPPAEISAGQIWFRDNVGTDAAPIDLLGLSGERLRKIRGGQIAMIFQEPMSALNPVYTCGFQLVEAIQLHQPMTKQEAQEQAISLLQEVRVLPDDTALAIQVQAEAKGELPGPELRSRITQRKRSVLDKYPHQFSGGQLQRITIAMALAGNPSILIADEPTTALDVTVQASILKLLADLRDRRGMAILFISHDLGVIAEIADGIAVMRQGKVVEMGTVEQIFSAPKHPYTQGLLACRPSPDQRLRYLPTVADFTRRAEKANREIQPAEVLEEFETVPAGEKQDRLVQLKTKTPLVQVKNLRVMFPIKGGFGLVKRYTTAVKDVSFEVFPGETLGLVGESGCGKSTLARTLLNLIKPAAGSVLFDGQNIFELKGRSLRALRRDIQIIFQDPASALNPRLSVGAAIMEPMVIHKEGTPKERYDRAADLLKRVDLNPDWMNRYPHEFSGGQRQRICIARALALNPRFIICDESVSALDVSVQAQVLNLLKDLQQDFGLTYIFISHDLGVVEFMSDRIAVMNQGRLEELGPAEDIYRNPATDYTKQLIAAIPQGTLEHIQQRKAS
ncbi:MAG: ABC transporter ATP-binding protein [Cyanobacteria bacterium P01_F01_bin.153]